MTGWMFRLWGHLPLTEAAQVRIMRLFNTRFTAGVVAILLDSNGRVVLFRHTYRHRYPWGPPGGFLRQGEPPEEALVREVREESGLRVRVERLFTLRSHPQYASLDVVVVARLLDDLAQARPDRREVDRVEAFAADALPPLRPEHAAWIREILGAQAGDRAGADGKGDTVRPDSGVDGD